MQDEPGQKPQGETDFVENYLLYLMAQASAAASSAFHAQLAAQGVSVAQWRIMASLYPDKVLNVGELARRCLSKQPTLTRQLDKLCAAGLTSRAHEDQDRRGVLVRLTPAGQAQAESYVRMADAHEREVLKEYAPEQVDAIKDALRDFTARLRGAQ